MKLFLFILIITQLINNSLFSQIDTNFKNNTFLNKDKDLIKDNLLSYDSVKIKSFFDTKESDFLQFVNKDNEGNYIFVGNTTSDMKFYNFNIKDTNKGKSDIFIFKFDNNFKLIWGILYGGSDTESPLDIEIDINNNIWICGLTFSKNLPKTRKDTFNVFKNYNGFICKISKNGEILFSETFGSNYIDFFSCLATDENGVCYVGGRSEYEGFTVTSDAIYPKNLSRYYHSVIVKVFPDGSIYSSYLFQNKFGFYSIEAIDVDNNGNIIVGGFTNDTSHQTFNPKLFNKYSGGHYDVYIQKYDKDFNLIWDNFFGGNGIDKLTSLAIGDDNNIYALINTNSFNLPVYNSLNFKYKSGFDFYLMKLDSSAEIIWSTYIGSTAEDGYGSKGDNFNKVQGDLFYNNYLIGLNFVTAGSNLPIVENSYRDTVNYKWREGATDAYTIILDYEGKLIYSTFYGSESHDNSYSIWFDENELIINGTTNGALLSSKNALPKYDTTLSASSNAGYLLILNDPFARKNKLNPNIAVESMNYCDGKAEYSIFDDNIPYGFRKIKIIENVNCDVQQSIQYDSLNLSINKINNELDAYYKIEILNYVGKKLIIQDSILTFTPNLLIMNPSKALDLGKISIFEKLSNSKVGLTNESKWDISITDAYFKKYKYFSFPLSQIPFTLPSKSNKDFTVCVSPQDMISSTINDTLVLISDCFYKELPVNAEYYIPNLNSDSKCDVSLEIIPDSLQNFNYQSIVIYKDELLIESINTNNIEVSIYDIFSSKVNGANVAKTSNSILIDFNNLANGTYFIYIQDKNCLNIIQLYLIR